MVGEEIGSDKAERGLNEGKEEERWMHICLWWLHAFDVSFACCVGGIDWPISTLLFFFPLRRKEKGVTGFDGRLAICRGVLVCVPLSS